MKRELKKNSILRIINEYIYDAKFPVNINYMYNWGSILGITLMIQIITGIMLAMFYNPNITLAFDSVEHLMREVPYGWLVRYTHANGASIFFIGVYLHIIRGLWYSSYVGSTIIGKRKGRDKVWIIGVIILIVMIGTAFIGYTLVYGQMSYWGATVITNLVTTIPYIGKELVEYIWGGYSIGNATMNRFYSIHYILPFIIAGLSIAHIITLHNTGGSNPLGVSSNKGLINFNPYYTIKDILGFIIMLSTIVALIAYKPNYLGHTDNYIEANSLVTPTHIVPEWYLLTYYAILRAIPNKRLGVILMLLSLLVLMLLPWLNKGIIISSKFRPINKRLIVWIIGTFVILLYIGQSVVEEPYETIGRVFTIVYFLNYIILIPLISWLEYLLYKFDR